MNSARSESGSSPCDGGTTHGQKRHAQPMPVSATVHALVTTRTTHAVAWSAASRRWRGFSVRHRRQHAEAPSKENRLETHQTSAVSRGSTVCERLVTTQGKQREREREESGRWAGPQGGAQRSGGGREKEKSVDVQARPQCRTVSNRFKQFQNNSNSLKLDLTQTGPF
jgi:hypothetical protein